MKRLILLRHAKSSWDAPVTRDFDRPLSKRGIKAGKVMGRYLLRERLRWDVLLVSPALRTMETVDRLEKGYNAGLEPLYDDRLYMASTSQLLHLVRGLDDAAGSAMIIGHNPGIQGLALTLTPSDDGANPHRARLDAKYPTAALAVIECPAARWADVTPASGRLERFVKPKDLKRQDDNAADTQPTQTEPT
jgi:phosphohistidine phosphatase